MKMLADCPVMNDAGYTNIIYIPDKLNKRGGYVYRIAKKRSKLTIVGLFNLILQLSFAHICRGQAHRLWRRHRGQALRLRRGRLLLRLLIDSSPR